jgi:Putative adhesin
MNGLQHASIAAVMGLALAMPAAAQDFEWRGQMAQGQSIEIKGVNGSIRAAAARGNEVEVTAAKSARRSNPAEVRFEVVPHAGGVTICAIYPSPQGQPANECRAGSGGRMSTHNNDTSVDFTVYVPVGVNFVGRTVNGDVDGDSLRGDVEAHTVNGSIRVVTTGLARATTVNGSINATMARTDWPGEAAFKTVNGEITVKVPATLNAELRAETVNGRIRSELPVTMTGQMERRRLRGTIGSGGRELALTTVNGGITLLK